MKADLYTAQVRTASSGGLAHRTAAGFVVLASTDGGDLIELIHAKQHESDLIDQVVAATQSGQPQSFAMLFTGGGDLYLIAYGDVVASINSPSTQLSMSPIDGQVLVHPVSAGINETAAVIQLHMNNVAPNASANIDLKAGTIEGGWIEVTVGAAPAAPAPVGEVAPASAPEEDAPSPTPPPAPVPEIAAELDDAGSEPTDTTPAVEAEMPEEPDANEQPASAEPAEAAGSELALEAEAAVPEPEPEPPTPQVAPVPEPEAQAPAPVPQPEAEAPAPVAPVPQPEAEAPAPVAPAPEPEAEAPAPVPQPAPAPEPEAVAAVPDPPVPAAAPAPPASVAPASDGPVMVLGVACSQGHHNHPDAVYCSQCGTKMGVHHTTVLLNGPRPPLGVLVVDDGTTYSLSEDLVIGREPTSHDDVVAGTASPMILTDDTLSLSRKHARIVLDDWSVFVQDLGSSNGTYLSRAGQAENWAKVEPASTVPLEPGDRLRVGGRIIQVELHHVR